MQKVVMSSHRTESKKRGIIGEKYLNGTEMKQEDFGEKKQIVLPTVIDLKQICCELFSLRYLTGTVLLPQG